MRRRSLDLVAALLALVGAACGSQNPQVDAEARRSSAVQTVRYGKDSSQVADLWLPRTRAGAEAGTVPVVVVIHGGFWRSEFDRHLMDALSADLASRGIAAWNIEYRRGKGSEAMLADVSAAIDALAAPERAADRLDLSSVVTLGHSAGGQLALWAATRLEPDVAVTGVVAQAPVADLRRGSQERLGGGAVDAFLGGSFDRVPERYEAADPAMRLPTGVPQVLVHGEEDAIVPLDQSTGYAELAREAGDDVTVVPLPGVDHFAVIDPKTDAGRRVVAEVERLLGRAAPDRRREWTTGRSRR